MRIAVAGLGAWGGAIAYHLSKQPGIEVVGFDRFSPPHDQGSTHGGSRGFRELDYRGDDFPALNIRSGHLWEQLQAESGIETLRRKGCVYIARPDHERIVRGLEAGEQHGLPLETLSPEEVRRRYPLFNIFDDEVALLEPRAGVAYPEAGVEAHIKLARQHGADIHFDEPVDSWARRAEGGYRITTAKGTYDVDRLVLATGSWLPELVEESKVEIERQVAVWYPRAEGFDAFADPDLPFFLFDHPDPYNAFYGFPDQKGEGIRVCLHYGGQTGKLSELPRETTEADLAPVHEALSLRLPALAGLTPFKSGTCWYTNTDPSISAIHPHPHDADVIIATGDAGRGFRIAPAVGETLVDILINDGSDQIPLVDKALWRR